MSLKTPLGVLLIVGSLGAAPAAMAQDGSDTPTSEHDSEVTITYRPRAKAFTGTIGSAFTSAEGSEEADVASCVDGRTVKVFKDLRRKRDVNMGTAVSSASGSWKLRKKATDGAFYARVLPHEFVYSPAYGKLERVVCMGARSAKAVVLKNGRVLGLRLMRQTVLGTRVARKSDDLPFTGPSEWLAAYTLAGIGLIGLGSRLVKRSSAG